MSSDEALKRMRKLVNSLLSRADCSPFAEPVDWRGLELWDYPKIIKKRMDLGTVKRKLERRQYDNHKECAEDVRLVWKNCMAYNQEGSDFYVLAKAYARRFEDRYKKIVAEFGEPEDDEEEESEDNDDEEEEMEFDVTADSSEHKKPAAIPKKRQSQSSSHAPLDAKARFSSRLFYLSGMELAHVVQTLELHCPQVLQEVGDSQLEIDVDAMDPNIFEELDAYVSGKVDHVVASEASSSAAAAASASSHSRHGKKRKR